MNECRLVQTSRSESRKSNTFLIEIYFFLLCSPCRSSDGCLYFHFLQRLTSSMTLIKPLISMLSTLSDWFAPLSIIFRRTWVKRKEEVVKDRWALAEREVRTTSLKSPRVFRVSRTPPLIDQRSVDRASNLPAEKEREGERRISWQRRGEYRYQRMKMKNDKIKNAGCFSQWDVDSTENWVKDWCHSREKNQKETMRRLHSLTFLPNGGQINGMKLWLFTNDTVIFTVVMYWHVALCTKKLRIEIVA